MDQSYMKRDQVTPLLFRLGVPMMISMLANSLYNIVDGIFIGMISGEAMTAISLVFPIQNIMSSLAVGFGIGINAVVAQALGSGDQDRAERAASQGMLLTALHGLILTAVSVPLMRRFLTLFSRDSRVIEAGVTYGSIVMLFSVIVCLSIGFQKLFQAFGRMKLSMSAMLVAAGLNMALDPCMIFGLGPFPALGIAGAAWATGISQSASLAFYLVCVRLGLSSVRLRGSKMKPEKEIARPLYSVGNAAAMNLLLPSVMISVMNSILAAFGASYVLLLGAYYKLQALVYMTTNGLVQGMRPLMAYNAGAGEIRRVREIYRKTERITGLMMGAGTLVSFLLPGQLIGLFTDDPSVIEAGVSALRIIAPAFLLSTWSVTASGSLEALGQGRESFQISLARFLVVILPVCWILSRFLGPAGVWHSFWIAELAASIYAVILFRRVYNRMAKSVE